MTDETAPGDQRVASAPPRPPAPEQAERAWSRTDPMAVPSTAPVWTYQHSFPPAVELEPTAAPEGTEAPTDEPGASEGVYRRGPGLGIAALLLAIAAVGLQIAGIAVSTAGDYGTGTVLAILAIAASSAAVVLGLVAVFRRAGRAVAIVGAILGVVANPLVLVTVLGLIGRVASID